jgi:hypothetical protein
MLDNEIRDAETNELCVVVRMALFIRGIGGFGYKGTIKSEYPPIPKSNPDMVQEEKTRPNQAILYRLCSDTNPLHVDPQMAAMGGFEAPILHGLCTYGFTARAVQ